MTYEIREGSGSLFQNSRKTQENQPDYQGSVRINGQLYELAGWKKVGAQGTPLVALKIQLPREKEASPAPAAKPGVADFTNDIPF